MIDKIIAQELASRIFSLTCGTNLYTTPTEAAQTVEMRTSIYHSAEHLPSKRAHIQFSIKGYTPEDAEALGNKIVDTIKLITGTYTEDTDTYNIMQCVPTNGPNYIKEGLYTANAEVHFTKE